MSLSKIFSLPALACTLALGSCSTIDKKDCSKDMFQFGLKHGQGGSTKMYTEQLKSVCASHLPALDLAKYEDGFYQGWSDYCRPSNAISMGKLADSYISFCPKNKESMFREKYLVGKRLHELNDMHEELLDELIDLRADAGNDGHKLDEIRKKEREIAELKRSIQDLEMEGQKDSFTLLNNF